MAAPAKIEVYMRDWCGFCARAKTALDDQGLHYTEYNIWEQTEKRDEMIKRSGGKTTVPQIFINDQHVGGSDDLMAAISDGTFKRFFQD